MDLSLTESQKMLKSAAHDFVTKECHWALIKQIDESESGFSPDLWARIAALGWLGIMFPEQYGGMGSGVGDLAVIYEEMGQALVPSTAFSSSVLCGSIITELGNEAQKQELLPAIAEGKTIAALALTEPDFGWKPECIHLTASNKDGKFLLNGTKRYVTDAQVADKLLVVARTSASDDPTRGITVFVIDKNTPGLSSRMISAFSGDKFNDVKFDSVEVNAAAVLGERDNGWAALNRPLNRATAILCAYMVGGCQHLLDMTVEYAQNRVQFGQPIGAFQWVQGYIIEQANQLEKARWFTNEALWKIDANRAQAEQDESVSLAKAVCSEAFQECGHLGHEVHAGLGVDKKYPLYLYSKKSKALYSFLGDPQHHKQRVAALLGL